MKVIILLFAVNICFAMQVIPVNFDIVIILICFSSGNFFTLKEPELKLEIRMSDIRSKNKN